MSPAPLVPPLKCQGIKTKLVRSIEELASASRYDRWVEPFCGSCVVALNVRPKRALLCDTNVHIIKLYRDVQAGVLTSRDVRSFLQDEGEKLRTIGEAHYYSIRDRFNASPTSLDFLFLNRSCFNGVIRFNRAGKFNVPYGHKPERFRAAYVTKIANQFRRLGEVLSQADWTFEIADFRETLLRTAPGDLVYCDPPYAGRHTDYFSNWSDADEHSLCELLKSLTCPFIFSTWHSNRFRKNDLLQENWNDPKFHVFTRKHFYHVGASEDLRNEMLEALVTNFESRLEAEKSVGEVQVPLF